MTDHLEIRQGKTFSETVRWSARPFITKAISAITRAAPAQITTATPHGLVDGWLVALASVGGMRQIKCKQYPPEEDEYREATVIDTTTFTLQDVDSSEFSAFTAGGFVHYRTPVPLAGYEGRLTIRGTVGGTALVSLTSNPAAGIVIDDTEKTITITISATATAALEPGVGVFELEMQSAGGVVTQLLYGTVSIYPPEIAT